MNESHDPDATPFQEPSQEPTLRPDTPPTGRGGASRAPRFAPGTIVAKRFRIVSLVGAGGMGEVYRAEDTRLGQTVALKFVAPSINRHDRFVAMLQQEVRLGREVSHPNVARLHDIYDWENLTFVSMEFIDGEDLSGLLRRIGRLPHDKGVEISREIARGLGAAHAKGVLHRDLKPANIMIDGRGDAKITDFGLAVEGDDRVGGTAGTPVYMAPELLAGKPATVQSDLYALGLVMYEIFTGRRVRSGRSIAELLAEHETPPSAPSSIQPDIEPDVEQVILRCLAVEPSERPRSVEEVLALLPGGDRLTAALAAGETPSPDAVVAAEVQGRISVPVAAALVTAIVALVAALLYLKEIGSAPALTDWSRQPAVLDDRAKELLSLLGVDPPAHQDMVLKGDQDVITWLTRTDSSVDRWTRLAHLPLYTLRWRGAAEPLATSYDPVLGAGQRPFDVEIELDLQGRLRGFLVRDGARPADTTELLDLTDLRGLRPVDPELVAPVDVEQRLAWMGRRSGSVVDERVEIGFRGGAPVWLAMQGPWDLPGGKQAGELPFATRALEVFLLTMGLLILGAAGLFAWRNTRMGRGDRTGAFRLAMFAAITAITAGLIGASWPPWLGDRAWILRQSLKDGLYAGVVLYVLYLALEPLVRRTWPSLLIAWRRLLDNRWRDPLVGRDVLIGIVGGVAHSVLASATWRLSTLRGEPAELAGSGVMEVLLSGREATEFLGLAVNQSIFFSLAVVFLLSVFAILAGRRWAAVVLMIALVNVAFYFAMGDVRMITLLISLVTVGITARFGLLAAVAMQYSFGTTFHYPLLLDTSRWFFRTSALPLLILAVLTVLAVRAATGASSPRRKLRPRPLESGSG